MISAIIFAAALLSLYLAFRYFNLARHLHNIPRAKIRSAPQGYVEIVGRARSLLPVPARTPETATACVWYEYHYREVHGDDSTVDVLRTTESFLIEDASGSCRIDPVHMRIESRSRKFNWFRKLALSSESGLIEMRWIGIGDRVHAYGKFTTLRSDFSSRRQEMIKTRLAALKSNHELRKLLDHNRDGVIDAREWEQAREQTIAEVDAEIAELQKNQNQDSIGHVLRAPDDAGLPFLLSSYSEMKIITRYRFFALMWMLCFLLLGAIIVDAYFTDWIGYEFERLLRPPQST